MEVGDDAAVDAAAAGDRLLEAARRPLTIGLILTVTAVAFEALAVATALPVTLRHLGGIRLYGWAFSAFFLTNLVGISVWGPQADRTGPARPYSLGMLLFAGGLVIGGLAPSMTILVVGRAVQGMGAGALSSTVYVGVGTGYPGASKAKMLAALSSSWVVPGLVGPAIAGYVAVHVTWRAVFLGLLPVLAVASALTVPALRALPRPVAGEHDGAPAGRFLPSLRVALGATAVLAGLTSRSPWLAVVAVVAGIAMAARPLLSLLPDGTFRVRVGVPAAVATRGALTFAFFTAESFLPLALTSVRHLTPAVAGLALTGASISGAGGSWAQARVGPVWSRRRSGVVGATLLVLGIAGTASALLPAVPVLIAPLTWAVAGAGMGFAYQVGTLVVLEDSPAGRVGALSSSLMLAEQLSIAVGTGIAGAIVAFTIAQGGTRRTGIAVVDVVTVAVAGLCLAASTRLPTTTGAAPGTPGDGSPKGGAG
jgi:MFS family permease